MPVRLRDGERTGVRRWRGRRCPWRCLCRRHDRRLALRFEPWRLRCLGDGARRPGQWALAAAAVYDDLWDLALDTAGDVYVTGGTRGPLAGTARGGEDIWTAKLAGGTGRRLAGRQIGTPEDDYGTAAAVSGTTLYLIGVTKGALAGTSRGEEDAVVIRLTTQ